MDIDSLIAACREAGDAALSLRGAAARKKADGSPVTDADMRAHDILLAHLSKTGYPTVSEESEPIPDHAKGRAWIIDPLDGTTSFVSGDPHWAIMAALVEDGMPLMGVVFAPELQTLWYAQRGKGAFVERDGMKKQMHVSNVSEPEAATIFLSQDHFSQRASELAKRLGAKVTRSSCVGIKAGRVAEGIGEMYWTEAQLGEWDTCAPQLIVEEAGGIFADARGVAIRYGSVEERPVRGALASNAQLRDKLIAASHAVLDA